MKLSIDTEGLRDRASSGVFDWVILTVGVVMLTTAVIGTALNSTAALQFDAEIEQSGANASL